MPSRTRSIRRQRARGLRDPARTRSRWLAHWRPFGLVLPPVSLGAISAGFTGDHGTSRYRGFGGSMPPNTPEAW